MKTTSRRRLRSAATITTVALLAGLAVSAVGAGTASAATTSAAVHMQAAPTVELAASKKVKVPDLVGKSGKTAEKLLAKLGLRHKWLPPEGEFVLVASNWKVTAQSVAAGTKVGHHTKISLTVVKKAVTGGSSEASAPPTFAPLSFSGSGDNVQAVNIDQPAIVKFSCPGCSDNTTLESNGPDSLIVNTIGGYSGAHLINTSNGALTTKFTIGADAAWTLTVSDLTTATPFTGAASGTGDQVIQMTGTFSDVALHNDGADNFVIQSYGNGDWDPLVANEIGAYSGTVPMTGPTYVDVESSGNWSITPTD
jgi:hypothetical protein